jgi:signal peptidase II
MESSGQASRRAWLRALSVALAVLVLDQLAKWVVLSSIDRGESVRLLPGIDLVDVRNTGVAFGLNAGGDVAIVALTAAVVAILMVFFGRNAERPYLWLSTGLLTGGAVSNLADRLRQGSVTDFIDLPAWPAFNVADVAIVAGAALLALTLLTPGDGDASTG